MRKYVFQVAWHEDFGTFGLKPQWYPNGDPLTGTRAQRRYARVIGGAGAVAHSFTEIQRECNKCLKHADEGMVLTVYLNVLRMYVRVECDYPRED